MRARGKLVISEVKAVIVWASKEAEILSQEIVKKASRN